MRKAEKGLWVAEGVGESGNEPPGTAVDRCISAGVEQSASWIVDKAADSTTKKSCL